MRVFLLASVLVLTSLPAFAEAWYEGGTLQKATVSQWQAASSENQLATSGDFIASISGVADLSSIRDQALADEFKKKAEDLQVCVNDAINAETPPDQPVAELIVRCTLLKGKSF